jgi:hypothetical protein
MEDSPVSVDVNHKRNHLNWPAGAGRSIGGVLHYATKKPVCSIHALCIAGPANAPQPACPLRMSR